MGLDQKIVIPSQKIPSWPSLAQRLTEQGIPLQLRMIDGQLAFPDETPHETWHELRISLPSGMVTLRREEDGLRLVIWGNAELALQEACHTLAQTITSLAEAKPPP
jgi:hypothetical protein